MDIVDIRDVREGKGKRPRDTAARSGKYVKIAITGRYLKEGGRDMGLGLLGILLAELIPDAYITATYYY